MSTKCTKCGKTVFAADKTFVSGKPWHKLCLIADSSKQTLNQESPLLASNIYQKSISQCLICGKRPDGTLIGAMYCPECYIKKHPVSKQSTQPPPQSLPLNAPLPGFVVKTPLLQNSSNEWTDSDNSDNDWDKDDEPLKSTQAPKFSNDNDSDSDWDEDEQTSVKKPVQKKKLLLKDNNKQQKDSLQLKDNLITRRFFEQIDIE